MPHDARGRKINIGDWVRVKPFNHPEEFVVGRVVLMREGQACCGEVRWLGFGKTEQDSFDADPALIVVRSDGSLPEEGREPVEA